jgi:hypothetical protein
VNKKEKLPVMRVHHKEHVAINHEDNISITYIGQLCNREGSGLDG